MKSEITLANGETVRAELLTITTIDHLDFAIFMAETGSHTMDLHVAHIYGKETEDPIYVEVTYPVHLQEVRKWFLDELESDSDRDAEDIMYGPLEEIRFSYKGLVYPRAKNGVFDLLSSAESLFNSALECHQKGNLTKAIADMEKADAKGCKEAWRYLKDWYPEREKKDFLFNLSLEAYTGNTKAQYQLGRIHELGIDTPKDDYEAAIWYSKAAEAGHVTSQYLIGRYYYQTRHLYGNNLAFSYYWLREAQKKGFQRADATLIKVKDKDPDMVINEEAWELWCEAVNAEYNNQPDLAFQKCLKSAEAGCQVAQCLLASYYSEGYGCQKDDHKMIYYYREAASAGNSSAMVELAHCYYKGIGIPANPNLAISYATQASDLGDMEGKAFLGNYYLWETEDGTEKARPYLDEAAAAGNVNALFDLGCMLLSGKAEYEPPVAKSYFDKAAHAGHIPAQIMLLGSMGEYYDLIMTMGPIVAFLCDNTISNSYRGITYIQKVDSEGSIYGPQPSHLCVYNWLFDADDEGDASHIESMMRYEKGFREHQIRLSRFQYEYGSSGGVDEYRLSHTELFRIGAQSDEGWNTVFYNIVKGLQLYLGEGYSVTSDKNRITVKKA